MVQTDLDEWVAPPVDPDTRAHIYSLVNAVGGTSIENNGRYAPGDDAFACLRDLRRWVKYYDAELGSRLDAVRCIAESNLVKNDLLEIIALWTEEAANNTLKAKLASACLELLVPLTWPVEIEDHLMRMSHHRHLPYVRLAQAGYKKAVLQHDSGRILRTAVRVALPSMAEDRSERTPKDDGIIRMLLYFLRNVVMLSHPQDIPSDSEDPEISRSATIEAFYSQDIFQLLLTVASSMGEDFAHYDVIVLEILFHLLKGVDAEKLFMEEQKLSSTNTEELKDLIQKEKAMLAGYARHAPSRHNRFGTMIWVKRDDHNVSTVSGQDVLGNAQRSLSKMDKTKKWNKRKHRPRKTEEDDPQNEFNRTVPLSPSARKYLRSFVEDFLDSSFNPLFAHLRKTIEREAERVLRQNFTQYFYLISWFLHAECARRRRAKQKAAAEGKQNTASVATMEDESFGLIAGVMNQETFILLNRSMQRSQDDKELLELTAEMRCFTQILLTVQEMSESQLDDDQEIAENIQNRIFYEESTHERVLTILRSYENQGFGYLDACTELSHVFLRMLERYSRQNVDLQVRSRRRARRKRKAAVQAEGDGNPDAGHESGGDDVVEAQRTTSERKFDFARFSARFSTQKCVDTFVAFTRYFSDLNTEQLKRAHRFFYRVAFKMELGVILYRVDILALFNKMVKGPDGLDQDMPAFKEWEELVKQIFRRAIKRLEERPELYVEMLFSKIPATMYFLEHGHDKEVVKRTPRAPAELEVKPGMNKSERIGVAVSILINQNKSDLLRWIKGILYSAVEERESWKAEEVARKVVTDNQNESGEEAIPSVEEEQRKPPSIMVRPDNDERRAAMFKDNKLRLLMTILGFDRLGLDDDPEATWIIPSDIETDALKESLHDVEQHEFSPPTYEDGKSAEAFTRSKAVARRQRRTEYDDDTDGSGSSDNDDLLFAAGGPTTRKSDVQKRPRKTLRRRHKTPEELDDEEKDRRAEARRKADREKREKIKSSVYVHDSDDESDEERDREFFAKEAERRKAADMNVLRAMATAKISDKPAKKSKKRKGGAVDSDESGLHDEDVAPAISRKKSKRSSIFSDESGLDSDADVQVISSRSSSVQADDVIGGASDEEEATDTPLSSQPLAPARGDRGFSIGVAEAKSSAFAGSTDVGMKDAEEADEEDLPVRKAPARRSNVRAGFLIDSDSE